MVERRIWDAEVRWFDPSRLDIESWNFISRHTLRPTIKFLDYKHVEFSVISNRKALQLAKPENRPVLQIEMSVNRTIDSMHPSCLGIMQVAFLGGFDDTKLPSCRCDVNGSMTVSKTVRLGSNPSTDASFSKDRLCMKRQSKRS